MTQAALYPLGRAARRALAASWLHPLNDTPAVDELLGAINPMWSLNDIRARVVEVILETHDTRTFVLAPNRRWPGFQAGQHVALEVEIDGVRHHRTYSLSAAPGGRRLALTVKHQPGGRVSSWLHQRVRIGDVLKLSAPAGDFVLPEPLPSRLLMLGAGSGVTPLMSMLRTLRARNYGGEIVFLHSCRQPADAIFGSELKALAAAWPALRLVMHYSQEQGRLDRTALQRLLPADLSGCHGLLCGPHGFMDLVNAWWHERGAPGALQQESFSGPVLHAVAPAGASSEVRCVRSERVFTAAGQPLLVEAESAGLRPKHGCRIGICHSCQCRKLSGTVENLLTGAVSSAPDETIQLCISAARSDLTLDL
ncbi:MAG: FAD-binding oxidoreductase [Nevskia sp.]|nr:FAD-binding oxidoreductase [Nevskia sp.]